MKGNISSKELRAKVVGVTGDCAFPKGNEISLLFEKPLTFRWDLLHLYNKAHIDACQVDVDLYSGNDISYLNNPNVKADICFDREVTFNDVLKSYLEKKKDLYKKF